MDIQRRLFVKFPPEAGLFGKLWLLKKGAYGISDGGRLFNLHLVKEMKQLGMHQVHADGTLFSYVKDGKLHGLVRTHSDELILAGNEKFERDIVTKLQQMFKFSKIEKNSFKYYGFNITIRGDGTIELDQNDYIERLEELDVSDEIDDQELTKQEIKVVRGKDWRAPMDKSHD